MEDAANEGCKICIEDWQDISGDATFESRGCFDEVGDYPDVYKHDCSAEFSPAGNQTAPEDGCGTTNLDRDCGAGEGLESVLTVAYGRNRGICKSSNLRSTIF